MDTCTPAAENTVFAGGRGAARPAPLGAIEVIGSPQQLNQVHAHIAVQVIVLSDDLLDVALHFHRHVINLLPCLFTLHCLNARDAQVCVCMKLSLTGFCYPVT